MAVGFDCVKHNNVFSLEKNGRPIDKDPMPGPDLGEYFGN